jgi:glycosyltransferase involved in cell wall biosynthesis
MPGSRRVAIIHYWLVGMRGGERVLERLLKLFPNADVFTHVYVPDKTSQLIRSHTIKTTFIQKLPFARSLYQKYLPLMPMALEQLDLTGYDLVISSESGPAKGVIASPTASHICYCHSPMRYLWDSYHEYLDTAGRVTRAIMPAAFHRLRQWDTISAARLDGIVANSTFVRQRIRRAWGTDSTVVFPPVAVDEFRASPEPGDYYLWLSQLVPYKRPDLAVGAFNRLGLPLLVVGDGPMAKRIEQIAGPNIRFKRRLNFDELKQTYAGARALIFTGVEDFGIVPVEANASGRPVIALGAGGVLDTIKPGVSGLFYHEQTVDALVDAVEAFERAAGDYSPEECQAQARRFAPERFDAGFMAVVRDAIQESGSGHVPPMRAIA